MENRILVAWLGFRVEVASVAALKQRKNPQGLEGSVELVGMVMLSSLA